MAKAPISEKPAKAQASRRTAKPKDPADLSPGPAPLAAAAPLRNPWRRAFWALLALNLALVGLMGGAALRGMGEGRMRPDLGFGPFSEALGPEAHQRMRAAFMGHRPDLKARRDQRRAETEALLGALRAEPFDPSAFETALGQMAGRAEQEAALGRQLLAAEVRQMSGAERHAFADRLEQVLRRGRR